MPNEPQQIQKKQQLSRLEQEKELTSGKMVENYINKMDYVSITTNDVQYQVYFDSQEQEEETRSLLTSDQALEQYYERTNPEMLQGLRSKNFFNFPGKKAERKRLRTKHMESISIEGQTKAMIAEYRKKAGLGDDVDDEKVLKEKRDAETAMIAGYFETYENSYDSNEVDDIMYKTYQMDPVKRERYAKLIQKQKEKAVRGRAESGRFKELQLYAEKMKLTNDEKESIERNYLYQTKSNELSTMAEQILKNQEYRKFVDADLAGGDSEEVWEYQTKIAKIYNTDLDYHAYRKDRRLKSYLSRIDVPDFVKEEMNKEKGKYSKGDIDRTCREFMKPVDYIMKDGKQVPATDQDAANLEYNCKWGKSLLSDKEEDWDFRFDEMVSHIDNTFAKRRKELEEIVDNLDEEKFLSDMEQKRQECGRTLIMDGITHLKEQNSLEHSAYFHKLPEARQKELKQKSMILTYYSNIFKFVMAKNGVTSENGGFPPAGTAERMAAPQIQIWTMILKQGLADCKSQGIS